MGFINIINNETTILWQIITKASTSLKSDANAKVGNTVTGAGNFMKLYPILSGAEFLLTLFDDI